MITTTSTIATLTIIVTLIWTISNHVGWSRNREQGKFFCKINSTFCTPRIPIHILYNHYLLSPLLDMPLPLHAWTFRSRLFIHQMSLFRWHTYMILGIWTSILKTCKLTTSTHQFHKSMTSAIVTFSLGYKDINYKDTRKVTVISM